MTTRKKKRTRSSAPPASASVTPLADFRGPLVHYAPGGGKNGPYGLDEWHMEGGWSAFKARSVDPARPYTDAVLIWLPFGSFKVDNPSSPTHGWFRFAQVRCALDTGNRWLRILIDTYPQFLDSLRADGWKTIISYTGCALDGLYDPGNDLESKINTHPYRNSHVAIDAMSRAPRDAWWAHLKRLAYYTNARPISEGRIPKSNAWMNHPEIGNLFAGHQTLSRPDDYVSLSDLEGFFVGAMLNTKPDNEPDKAAWQRRRDSELPTNIHRVFNLTEQLGGAE